MKAIIITDQEARSLLDRLELRAFQIDPTRVITGGNREEGVTAGDVHRKFHYEVTRWLQEMGANVVR